MLPSTVESQRRRRPSPMAAVAAALLLVPALAGCLDDPDAEMRARFGAGVEPSGGDFRVPTTEAPSATEPSAIPEDRSPDPRLELAAAWSAGDEWYYESNRSHYMRVTVLGFKKYDDTPHYVVRTQKGLLSHRPTYTEYAVVTLDFLTVNVTRDKMLRVFDPPHPALRFLPRWDEFAFNETVVDRETGERAGNTRSFAVLVTESWPLYPVKVPAGVYNASHFTSYQKVFTEGNRAQINTISERWYSPDVRHDVMFKTVTNRKMTEWYQLVYFVRDGEHHGIEIEPGRAPT